MISYWLNTSGPVFTETEFTCETQIMKLHDLLTIIYDAVQPWQTERALALCLCAIARDCILVLMWEMQNRMPLFCPSPIPSFPLYCAFKSIGKKGKRIDVCVSPSFTAIFCWCRLHALQTSLPGMQPTERDYFRFFHGAADVIFLTLIPSLCLTAILHNRKNKTKSSSFIKWICAKQPEGTWKDWIFRERRLVCASHFPRSSPIRRKAIGNEEIREVILEFGRVLIIIMSAVVCVRVYYNVTGLEEGTVCECVSSCGFSCVCVSVFLITSASGAWASWHINVRYRWHTAGVYGYETGVRCSAERRQKQHTVKEGDVQALCVLQWCIMGIKWQPLVRRTLGPRPYCVICVSEISVALMLWSARWGFVGQMLCHPTSGLCALLPLSLNADF